MSGDARQAAPVPPPGQGSGTSSAAGQPGAAAAADAAAAGGEGQRGGRWLARRLITANETWTLLALIVLGAFFTIRAPGRFFTLSDFSLIAQNSAALLVMAVGQTFVILTAGIDLSVGAVLVLSGVVADLYYIHHGGNSASWVTIAAGAVIGVATGGGWGAVQGFLVAKARIVPLITTLAGFGAATGASYLITGGADFRTVPARLVNTIGLGGLGGLPWLIVISFATAIVFGLILAYTRFGRYTYAIGSSPVAAERAGIAVEWHLIKVYALGGALSGLAGIMSLANFNSTTIAGHSFDNLSVITAVVLGGASLFGGRGSMLGTVIGVFIPAVLLTGLVIINVNQYWQDVAIGLVLAAAVYLDQFRRRLRERT
ncbi:MAG TPA: ABC transporter permease [Streptosporangiaceae bacterium]|nr:ABC transporter permease [Streptosporangiaceae bacterium]